MKYYSSMADQNGFLKKNEFSTMVILYPYYF
jgi:hypothetical protein